MSAAKRARRPAAARTSPAAGGESAPSLTRVKGADAAWIALFLALAGWLVARNYLLGRTEVSVLELGPLTLSPFGFLVALDLLFGYHLVKRWCERLGLDWEAVAGGLVWIAGLGLYISHLVSVAAYYPEDLLDPIALIDFRTRISSFGGMFGGAVVAIVYLKRRGLPVWRYADALAYGFVGGYVFGRMGCFAIHDHPGVETGSPLGIVMDGVKRHDLGFYEMWLMLALLLGIHWVARRGRPPDGAVVAFAATIYAPVRFAFDSLRIVDVRYAGLTPGQWFCFPMAAVALWAWTNVRRQRA